MNLKVLGSSSSGNSYVLENENEALLIDAGVNFKQLKKALNYNVKKINGCIISHYHLDHSYYIDEFMLNGIKCYSNKDTFIGSDSHNSVIIQEQKIFYVGNFKIMAFNLSHDVPCYGYLINHKETGNVLFVTDTKHVPYTFKGLNNIIIEANYSETILQSNIVNGKLMELVGDRVRSSHMSLETCKTMLSENDLDQVNNIVLIHLSDGNTNHEKFKKEIIGLTGKNVHIATKGLNINFNKTGI